MMMPKNLSAPTSTLGPLGLLANKLALLYLATPVALFLAFWFQPIFALPLVIAFVIALAKIVRAASYTGPLLPSTKQTLAGLFCATAAISLSIIAFPTSISIPFEDFAKHQALLHDLTTYPWPVTFFREDGSRTILRYSFAYYLVPAGLAKVFGSHLSQYFLFAWTSLGIFLFFLLVADIAKSMAIGCCFVVAVALFSGLDIPYWLLKGASLSELSTPVLDAWSRQYSCGWLIGSNPFSLRWAPQHTVAAFLGAALLHRFYAYKASLRSSVVTFSILVLWSPFVALSYAVLALALLSGRSRKDSVNDLMHWETFAALAACAAVLVFILSDPQGIPSGLCSGVEPVATLLTEYLTFVAVEFGAVALILFICRRKMTPLGWASVALLLILPFVRVGASSDLQMRGSEIPICLLVFLSLEALQERKWNITHAALLVVILAGMAGGLQELMRGGINLAIGRTDWSQSVFEVNWDRARNGINYPITTQYVAQISDDTALPRVLANGHAAFAVESLPIDLMKAKWHEFGQGYFDFGARAIQSEGLTDASLYSDCVWLPAGFYRLQVTLEWDAEGERIDGVERAAHVSLFGDRKLINITNSSSLPRTITVFTQIAGGPTRLAFGLGGWAKGQGRIQMTNIRINRVSGPPDYFAHGFTGSTGGGDAVNELPLYRSPICG